jgi:hypothetical protein
VFGSLGNPVDVAWLRVNSWVSTDFERGLVQCHDEGAADLGRGGKEFGEEDGAPSRVSSDPKQAARVPSGTSAMLWSPRSRPSVAAWLISVLAQRIWARASRAASTPPTSAQLPQTPGGTSPCRLRESHDL